jgi:Rha family phage regulatory protein
MKGKSMESLVFEKQDKPMTDSLKVSQGFNKRHSDVLRDINVITAPDSGVSKDFTERNFALSFYKDESGKRNPMRSMTYDGFMILVMGYHGKRAMQQKEKYIAEFNRMSDFIRQLDTARLDFHDFAQAIKDAHDEPRSYHFSNEFDLINRIVLGTSTRKYKKEHGIEANSIRELLTPAQLDGVIKLQRFDMGLVITIPEYEERKHILLNYYARINRPRLKA